MSTDAHPFDRARTPLPSALPFGLPSQAFCKLRVCSLVSLQGHTAPPGNWRQMKEETHRSDDQGMMDASG